jgi:hypothetical protein
VTVQTISSVLSISRGLKSSYKRFPATDQCLLDTLHRSINVPRGTYLEREDLDIIECMPMVGEPLTMTDVVYRGPRKR